MRRPLVILDEIHRTLELFQVLRGTIRLWVRGGLPDSFLAASDVRQFHYWPRIPAETLERLWTMLAVIGYIDLLVDLPVVRSWSPITSWPVLREADAVLYRLRGRGELSDQR